MSYQQLNKLKEAENAYAEALLLNPNDAQSTYQIALVYLAMGNRGFATIHYLSLQKLNPDLAKKLHDQMFTK
jgi:tetratricopeptide (TPR) repeat protein